MIFPIKQIRMAIGSVFACRFTGAVTIKNGLKERIKRVWQMIDILMVVDEKASFEKFASTLEQEETRISWETTGEGALRLVAEKQYSLLVVAETMPDMSGLELAKKTVMTNPMVNLALMSALPHKDFHEKSEGLGVLCQLPLKPSEKDALFMLNRLKEVL